MTEAETIANAVNEMLRQMAVDRDRIEELEAALRKIISNNPIHGDTGSASIKDIVDAIIRSSTIARAALGEKKDG